MKKRLLSILLALCLVAGLLPTVALAGETPVYSIENGTLVISGTTNGSDLPTEGFTSIKITETGVVTGGTYTVDVDNYGTITGGEFGSVMNRNGGTGSGLALIESGTFEKVSNYGNMTGGTVKDLTNSDTTNYGHTVQGVTVTGSLYNSNSNCNDMTLLIGLTSVTNNLSITTVRQLVNGTGILCPVGQNADSWLKSNVANADWYQLNGEEWVKLTDTDVFPCGKTVYSKIPGMSLGTMGSMQDIISGNWIVPVADSENPYVINRVFNGKIGVFNSSAVWYVAGQPVEGKFSPPAMSYTVTEADIGKDAVAKLTDGYATIQSPAIRIVKSLSVTVPATAAVGETITPVFNWQLKTNYSEGMTYQWQRDGVDIEGATSYTYTATESDLNHKLTLKIFVKGTHYYTTDEVAVATLHTHCICGGNTAVGDHTSHTDVTWIGVSSLGEITGTGSYYLTDDILMSSNLEITGTVNLCLNGYKIYTLPKSQSYGYGTVKIQTGAALNVCDCSEDESGLITTCRGSYAIENSGTLNLYSGSVERSSDDNEAAVKVNAGAVFHMYGGKIGGNAKAIIAEGEVNAFGGTVSAKRQAIEVKAGSKVTVSGNAALSVTGTSNSTIAIYGGTVNICGGTVTNASGVAVYVPSGESTLNISGGKISTSSSAKKDTILLASDSAEVTVTGGSITNGYPSPATSGSSIYGWAIGVYNVKSLTISGAPEINRIYLAEGHSITVGEGGLENKTPIEIHCAKCPAPVTGANDTDYSSKFTPRSIFYAIINAKDNVVLFTKAATVTYTDGVDGEEIFPDQPHSTYLGQPTPAFNGTPKRTGYAFAGWYTDTGYTTEYNFSTPVTGNLTLYAKWTVNQYTITFDTDGGTTIAPITQDYGTDVTAPADPTKTGYTFNGWEPAIPETMPAENLTIKAKWTINQYTITFDTDGGTTIAPITQDYGTAITAPENPTKTGYTFAGWEPELPETMPAGNLTITAQWTINQYTITYDLDGGTVEGNPDSYTVETNTFTLKNPTKRGYTFTGWSGTGLTGENNLTVTIEKGSTGDRNYTAHWRYNGSYIPTYPITVESARHGDVTSSHKTAAKGTTVTLTVVPDKGYTLETITVTDASGDEIELTNKGDGKYTFKMPGSKVTVEATFMEDNSMLNFFVDVFPGDYYYDAVLWAAENGITGGVDAAHFAPNASCTRAQAVTFLWRAAGCPAPKSSTMPFTDVAKGSYYYDAVSWAVENGITKGTSDTTFSPDATCTRGQIVTFLWRAQQSPAAGSTNPFADVAADAYYADAVLWAVREDITNGTSSTTFSPDATCTRAQIVTFLYRCLTGE